MAKTMAPQRSARIGRLPTKGLAPRVTAAKGPDTTLVDQLLTIVNCSNPRATGLSTSQCQRVKALLRTRLQGYRVLGRGTPKQRVNLYLAKGCPAKEDFRRKVAQEVTSSMRSLLGPTSGKAAARLSSLFNPYWQRMSNVPIGNRGTFQSVLIAPIDARSVNVSTLASGPCSNTIQLPQTTFSGGTSSSGSTSPSTDSDQSLESSGTSESPAPDPTPPPSSTPLQVNQSEFLARHNTVRANVTPPAATPLPALKWNQQMADVAQSWANQCVLGYNEERGAVGENLYITTAPPDNVPQQAVQAWASEAPNYEHASNSCAPGQICGHYTQLVWESTTELGCGMASCPSIENFAGGSPGIMTVCDYSPRGNFNNQPPYQTVGSTEAPPPGTTSPSYTPLPEAGTFPNLQSAFLGYHNTVRASVLPSPSPPLPSLTWNQQMADVAQGWANQCVLGL